MSRELEPQSSKSALNGGIPAPGAEEQRLSLSEIALLERKGFELQAEAFAPEMESLYLFLRHRQSGARVVLVQNKDEHLRTELRFRTLPTSSNGVFHKLEHGVISSSGRMSLANPFDEMSRSLLLTEVNAATYPDFTNYYACGTDEFSVSTMTRVFAQAVLGGRPSEESYLREHGHLRPDPREPCGYRFGGVVHDEMLGYYSSPLRWAGMEIRKALFPGTPYASNAGGDPLEMPSLTLREYQETYDAAYSSSRLVLGLYGRQALETKLAFVNKLLVGKYAGAEPAPLPEAVVFDKAQIVTARVPAEEGSPAPLEKQHQFFMAWKFERVLDYQRAFELTMLKHLLSNADFSPFNREYLKAGITNNPGGASFESCGRENYFLLAFDNCSKEEIEACRVTSRAILERFARDGFPADSIEAVLNAVSHGAEKFRASTSRGEGLLSAALISALRGECWVDTIPVSERVKSLKARLAAGEPVFQALIRDYLLQNQNRVELTLLADPDVFHNWLERQRTDVARKVSAMSPAELKEVEQTAERMREHEASLKSLKAIAKAPKAVLKEEYRRHTPVINEVSPCGQARLVYFPQDLGESASVSFFFNISHVPAGQLPLANFLLSTMTRLGPQGMESGEYQTRIYASSSGLSAGIRTLTDFTENAVDMRAVKTFLRLSATVRPEQSEKFMELLLAPILNPQLDNRDFNRKLVDRLISSSASSLNSSRKIPGFINARLAAATRPEGSRQLALQPEAELQALAAIKQQLQSDPAKLFKELRELHTQIFRQGNLTVTAACSEDHWAHLEAKVRRSVSALTGPESPAAEEAFEPRFPEIGVTAGLSNNYVGLSVSLKTESGADYDQHGVMSVASQLLGRFLRREIRETGGAYGAGCTPFDLPAQMIFRSWQDPELAGTIATFRRAPQFLREEVTDDSIERARISAMKGLLTPLSPEDWAAVGTNRLLSGLTPARLDRERQEIMDASRGDILALAEALERGLKENAAIVVYGSRAQLEKARAEGLELEIVKR